MGKVNFVEIRSFWHIFRSFDRMWSFYILCLQVPISFSQYVCLSKYCIFFLLSDVSLILVQAMIVIAWNGSGELSGIFQGDVFLKVLSIFITAAILKLAQGDDTLSNAIFVQLMNSQLQIFFGSFFLLSLSYHVSYICIFISLILIYSFFSLIKDLLNHTEDITKQVVKIKVIHACSFTISKAHVMLLWQIARYERAPQLYIKTNDWSVCVFVVSLPYNEIASSNNLWIEKEIV